MADADVDAPELVVDGDAPARFVVERSVGVIAGVFQGFEDRGEGKPVARDGVTGVEIVDVKFRGDGGHGLVLLESVPTSDDTTRAGGCHRSWG